MTLTLIVLAALALGVAACSGTAVPAVPSTNTGSQSATAVPSVEIPPDAIVVELSIPAEKRQAPFQLDGRPIERIDVKADQPYVFRITNAGRRDHNFFIGVEKDLAAREYSRLRGVDLWSGGVREVVYTFKSDAPPLQLACTLAGHYGLMHADIVVEP